MDSPNYLSCFVLSIAALGCCEQPKSSPPKTASTSEPATTASAPASTAAPKAEPPLTPEGSLSPAEAKDAQRKERAGRDLAFQTQPIDVEWARPVEAKLGAAFANLENGIVLASVECRKTLCRLEFKHPTSALDRLERNSGTTVMSRISNAISEDDGYLGQHETAVYSNETETQTTYYVSRNHYTLPDSAGVAVARPKVKPGSR